MGILRQFKQEFSVIECEITTAFAKRSKAGKHRQLTRSSGNAASLTQMTGNTAV